MIEGYYRVNDSASIAIGVAMSAARQPLPPEAKLRVRPVPAQNAQFELYSRTPAIDFRTQPGGKKPPLGLRVFSRVLFMHWIVAGLDRGRFHWSDDVPGWLQGICLFTVAAGYALALWAMRVNRFFSSVIRIQADRGQHVVTTGPY